MLKRLLNYVGNYDKDFLKNYFSDWSTYEKVWLGVFTLINVVLFFVWDDTLLSLTASMTGIWCVVLVAKGKISNYLFGVVNVSLYAWLSYQQGYFGEVMLNGLYFLPMQFIGIWFWLKNKNPNKKDSVYVKVMSNRLRGFWLAVSGISIFLYGLFLKSLGGNLPFFDSTSTVLSVIAQILMTLRYMEQWILWIFVNIVTIIMWITVLSKGGINVTMVVMWSAYLVNSIYGTINWWKMAKEQEVV